MFEKINETVRVVHHCIRRLFIEKQSTIVFTGAPSNTMCKVR